MLFGKDAAILRWKPQRPGEIDLSAKRDGLSPVSRLGHS
jgi:hypothetical protein